MENGMVDPEWENMRIHSLGIHKIFRLGFLAVPFLGHALTSGPAMPEYNDFEAVDATDMVNLSTGDFSYTLPVMTVPGPGMGFPIVLSYHSGILQKQEASWVGLGWNLQAGSITRQVNKVPDDFKGDPIDEYVKSSKIYGWTASIGYNGGTIGISWDNSNGYGGVVGAGLSMGLASVSMNYGWNGVYQGLSSTAGIGLSAGENLGLSIGVQGDQLSLGIGTGSGPVAFSGGVGIGSRGMDASMSVSLASVQASLSSSAGLNGGSNLASVAQSSSIQGERHSESNSANFSIPTPVGLFSFGLSNWATWIEGWETNYYYGFLYSDKKGMGCHQNSNQWDCSDWSSSGNTNKKKPEYVEFTEPWDPIKRTQSHGRMMGTAEDTYIVATQGLQGVFKPYRKEDGDYTNVLKTTSSTFPGNSCDITGLPLCDRNHSVNRSQQLERNMDLLNSTESTSDVYWRFLDDIGGAEFGDKANRSGTSLISVQSKKITPFFKNNKIIGFQIQKEDGTRYLYTQALYNHVEIAIGKELGGNDENGDPIVNSTTQTKPGYAYAWLLTGILGPDYYKATPDCGTTPVCPPQNGDMGQWVRFEYGGGKAANSNQIGVYGWKTPYYEPIPELKPVQANVAGTAPGAMARAMKDGQYYSSQRSAIQGVKDIAFLRLIETPTHRAEFELSDRLDGKSGTVLASIKIPTENILSDEATDTRLAKPPSNPFPYEQFPVKRITDKFASIKLQTGKTPGTKVDIFVSYQDIAGALSDGQDLGGTGFQPVLKKLSNLTVDNLGRVDLKYSFPTIPTGSLEHKFFLGEFGLEQIPSTNIISTNPFLSKTRVPYSVGQCGFQWGPPTFQDYLKSEINRTVSLKVPESVPVGTKVRVKVDQTIPRVDCEGFVTEQSFTSDEMVVPDNRTLTYVYKYEDLFAKSTEWETSNHSVDGQSKYIFWNKPDSKFSISFVGADKMKKLDRILLVNKAQGQSVVASVNFTYDYSLSPGTPNSEAETHGKLTLLKVRQGAGANGPFLPSYDFSYHEPSAGFQSPTPGKTSDVTTITNLNWVPWEIHQFDRWGYRCQTCSDVDHFPHAGDAVAWNLKEITTPSGASIRLEYEPNKLKYLMYKNGPGPLVRPNGVSTTESEILLASGTEATHVENTFDYVLSIPLSKAQTVLNTLGLTFKRYKVHITPVGGQPRYRLEIAGREYECPTQTHPSGVNSANILLCTSNPTDGKILDFQDEFSNLPLQTQFNVKVSSYPSVQILKYEIFAIVENPASELEMLAGGVRVKSVTLSDPFTGRENKLNYTYENGIAGSLPPTFMDFDDSRISSNSGYEYYGGSSALMYGKVNTQFQGSNQLTTYEFITPKELPVVIGPMVGGAGASGTPGFYSVTVNDFSGLWGTPWRKSEFDAAGNKVREELSKWVFNSRYTDLKDLLFNQVGGVYKLKSNSSEVLTTIPEVGVSPNIYPYVYVSDDGLKASHAYKYFGIQQTVASHRYFWNDCVPDANGGTSNCPQDNVAATQVVLQRILPMKEGSSTSQDGVTSRTKSYYPDFFTGAALKTLSTNSDGSELVTEAVPAYPLYSRMAANHMLSQTYSQTKYLYQNPRSSPYVDEDPQKAVASSVTRWWPFTFTNSLTGAMLPGSETFRIREARSWRNVKDGAIQAFNLPKDQCTVGGTGYSSCLEADFSDWVSSGRNLQYDNFGRPIEFRMPDGTTNCQAYGYGKSLPVAFAQNTGGSGIFTQSFEEFDYQPPYTEGYYPQVTNARSKTGKSSFRVYNTGWNLGETCFDLGMLKANTPYVGSVWYYDEVAGNADISNPTWPGISLLGTSNCRADYHPMHYPATWEFDPATDPLSWPQGSREWKRLAVRYTCNADAPSAKVCIYAGGGVNGGYYSDYPVFYDELRVRPEASLLTTYTYNTSGQILSMTDPREVSMFFEYDLFGKLSGIRNDDGILLSEKAMPYGRAGK
jgi:YD repeat-containing protein